MWIYVIAALLGARLLWHVVCAVQYYQSAYFKGTRKRYLPVIQDTGKRGEYLLYKELKDFEKTGARFLFNTYLPQSSGQTTEIDVMMIHSTGVFVFENKNYAGWIFGSPDDTTWLQRFQKSNGATIQEERFFNPIKQNDVHVRALQRAVPGDLPIYSVIVFGNRCELKNLSESITEHYTLCRTYSVQSNVSRIGVIEGRTMKQEQVEQIYNVLFPYSQVSDRVKRAHVADIQRKHKR